MFSSIGWGEILLVAIVAFIIIGPERLPGLIEDVRAGLIAARRAIDNVKAELNEGLGDEFKDMTKPLATLANYQTMGPKAMLTKTLFNGDSSLADQLDIQKQIRDNLGARPTLNYENPARPDTPSGESTPPPAIPPSDYGDVI